MWRFLGARPCRLRDRGGKIDINGGEQGVLTAGRCASSYACAESVIDTGGVIVHRIGAVLGRISVQYGATAGIENRRVEQYSAAARWPGGQLMGHRRPRMTTGGLGQCNWAAG